MRKITMHWITILGIVLIAAGTILACFGQSFRDRFDNRHLHQTIREKTSQINELTTRVNEYQNSLAEKDEIIQQSETQVDKQNVTTLEELADKQTTTNSQVYVSSEYNDLIAQARNLSDEGKYDEAYKIADDLRQKNPGFGLAYFVLGTIEMRKEHYDKGEELLNRAVSLKLPKEDMAWVYHNLGIASVRKKDFEKAIPFLEKSLELNPNIEKSRKALNLLHDYLQTKNEISQARSLYEEGKYDEAYKMADDLRKKNPGLGLAYFILGTIEMQKRNHDKGEDLLTRAVQLELSDEDMAWAFHNLGISSLRRQDFEKARQFLEKAVASYPNMEDSEKALNYLDNLQKEEGHEKKKEDSVEK